MSSQTEASQMPPSEPRARRHAQPLRAALAIAPLLLAGAWALLRGPSPALAVVVLGGAAQLALLLATSVRVAAPWERAVIVRGGRPVAVRGPGLYVVLPLVEEPLLVDLRLRALGLQRRRALTQDHKPVWVEAGVFYQVHDPMRALATCRDLDDALAQAGHAALHAVIARVQLDALEKRPEQVENDLEEELARRTERWGVRVDRFRLLATEPVYLVSTQRERAIQETTEEPAAASKAELPPATIHDEGRSGDNLPD